MDDINDDEPMHGEDDLDDNVNNPLVPQRWTCEACGCNTNITSDRNCTICGTSNTPPSHFGNHFHPGGGSASLRRVVNAAGSSNLGNGNGGISAGYSAAIRAGWLARSLNHHASRLPVGTNNNNNNSSNVNAATAAQLAGMMDAAASGSPMNDDFSFDDDDLWESVMHGIADPTNNHSAPPHPLELQFAMGVNNYAAARNRYVAESNRHQRLLHMEAASRGFSHSIRESLQSHAPSATLVIEPDDLYRIATLNAAVYQPNWADLGVTYGSNSPTTSTRSSRSAAAAAVNSNSGIELSGSALERNQVAHVMFGATEGRSIRAEQPFPRTDRPSNTNIFDPFHLSLSLSPANSHDSDSFDLLCNAEMATMQQQSRSRVFGFRVAFDNPAVSNDHDSTQVGMDLGGCFLVGVTSSSFTSYTESSALQQSHMFWGIEDHGQIFEGSKQTDMSNYSTAARTSSQNQRQQQNQRRPNARHQDDTLSSSSGLPASVAASFSLDLGVDETIGSGKNNNTENIEMNSHSVLFGLRDVVSVVCDLDNRTLTFWRNDTLLGTLVSNLPRSGNLYPLAVPFNAGSTVAITSIKGDPLQLLRSYAADWRQKQEEKNQKIKSKLAKERLVLIKDGIPTLKLQKVLYQIFSMYADHNVDTSVGDVDMDHAAVSEIMASRLWYRCGMKLSTLDDILRAKERRFASFRDFFSLIKTVIDDEEGRNRSVQGDKSLYTSPTFSFEIGDKVELVDGYERYGDASSGPLQVGDRGIVVDVQRGPNGDTQSVRVLHSGRRWWYHVQAIISEKSGLIECPCVWFLNGILRSHGFDHTSLVSFIAKSVTPQSWRVGDIVTHKSTSQQSTPKKSSVSSPSPSSMIGRIAMDTLIVPSLSTTVSRQTNTVAVEFVSREFADSVGVKIANASTISIETRRVKTSKLVHTTEIHGSNFRFSTNHGDGVKADEDLVADEPEGFFDPIELFSTSVNDKVLLDIESMRCLDRSAIDALAKQCRKSSDTLASMFAAGLPDAIMEAISIVERQMNSLEPKDDLPDNLTALGSLANALTEQLYGNSFQQQDQDDMDIDVNESQKSMPWQNAPRNAQNRERVRSNVAVVTQREALRGGDRRGDSQFLASSLQQRQNMLLSLMSRASRTHGNGGNDVSEVVIEPFGQISRAVARTRSSSPFRFGGSNELLEYEEHMQAYEEQERSFTESPLNLEGESTARDDKKLPQDLDDGKMTIRQGSALDQLLRCHGSISSIPSSGSTKQGGAAFAVFVRHFIRCGVLFDSAQWAEALITGHRKNYHIGSQSKASTILRGVVDEEGTPILILAIILGCSVDLICCLIKHGASVGNEAIVKAVATNQPKTLSLLLQHTAYEEGIVDLQMCSPRIRRLLVLTKSRQDELSKRMEEAAGGFIARLLIKLVEVGLSSRQIHNARVDKCSKIICEVLVGNVLLRALQVNQKATAQADDGKSDVLSNQNDMCLRHLSQGLLGALPLSVFRDFLFCDVGNITKFFLLCEDYLCSKDMADIASGLTFLSLTLSKFPQIRSSSEMDRFGMCEFVSNHKVLSSNRIADILSKELNIGLDVSANTSVINDSDQCTSVPTSVVLCPKKHTATLHITPHSSFRCDICTSAVPKGEYIFGCRQCDYDECLQCTLRDEKRTLGVQMVIRELASECYRILTNDGNEERHVNDADFSIESSVRDELKSLSIRLLQRDVLALKDLGIYLTIPGRITIHEFLTVILPSLHASIVGHSTSNDGLSGHSGTAHKNKKARASRGMPDDTLDSRMKFCREALRHMISGRVETNCKSATTASMKTESIKKLLDCSLSDDENESNEDRKGEKLDISCCAGASELLRRLHQILTFYENVPVLTVSVDKSSGQSSTGGHGDLHELTKPLELVLSPSFHENSGSSSKQQSVIYAEPLIPLAALQLHVLRAHRITDDTYTSYCQSLVDDMAIIIERPKSQTISSWKIAKIGKYDATTGGHIVRYATGWIRGKERSIVRLGIIYEDFSSFTFDSQASIILAAREYYILSRTPSIHPLPIVPSAMRGTILHSQVSDSSRLVQAIGSRVESSCSGGSSWKVLTLAGIDAEASEAATDGMYFILVSDDGEVFAGVPAEQIRARGSIVGEESLRQGRPGRISSDERNTLFPYLAIRERIEFARSSGERMSAMSDVHNHTKALKRTWSALSLMDEMRPVDLKVPAKPENVSYIDNDYNYITMECKLDGSTFQLVAPMSSLENPPLISVHFSTHEKLPTMNLLSTPDTTLISALYQLHKKQKKWSEWPPKPTCRLFFSLELKFSHSLGMKCKLSHVMSDDSLLNNKNHEGAIPKDSISRCRKLSASLSPRDDESNSRNITSLCEGVDEICVQCMEAIGLISECAKDPATPSDREILNLPGFANLTLSSKLISQLNQTMCCVGAALPDWCLETPAFAPHIFTYESRRMLLERTAFGPSRSTLCQQETKVNVGKFRQRMASLRARAVELVGEAFAGGAEDPTALQLQADELYGMEEALASRVKAAFRAAKWQEHALQVAKAAVRRDRLLSDASSIMDRYTNDRTVCRRRLEVRFEGESGFDAASGDEAGVTRGFYADVAEALLSVDIVAGVCCSSQCLVPVVQVSDSSTTDHMQLGPPLEDEAHKLPIWIPDFDSNMQVIIPTPRAAKGSCLGVFPRPIPKYHPQFDSVIKMFRLMGRLFAAALRDGFMFPVPISAAFLKLVQHGSSARRDLENGHAPLLDSDLPRPGFLGGEVYAADYYVCRALDRLDAMDPPLSRHDLKRAYEDISTDPNFARIALGRSYDCSFEEYFQDRTFVDPIDPAQDADAAPLCHKGHTKSITIYNVREWVTLAKNFMLYDGVIEQAMAFRRGVDDFFPSDYLRVFTSDELQRDVFGVGDDVDRWNEVSIRKLFKLDGGNGATEALVAVAAIGGEGGAALSRRFGPSSPTISFLIKALLEASSTQRRQFLNFVTSVPIASVKMGTIEVVPILSPSGEFLPMHDPSCLPRANTCSRRLYLPKFETYESFSEVLWAVVREESKFKGFYEWRGS